MAGETVPLRHYSCSLPCINYIFLPFKEDTTGGGVPQSLREKSDAIVQVRCDAFIRFQELESDKIEMRYKFYLWLETE
jgi:hypothetical protein